MLIQFFKKGKRKKGVFIAEKHGDEFFIGFSLCSNKDSFDKNRAIKMAIGRAKKSIKTDIAYELPISMYNQFSDFYYRCKSYYKNCVYSNNIITEEGF